MKELCVLTLKGVSQGKKLSVVWPGEWVAGYRLLENGYWESVN